MTPLPAKAGNVPADATIHLEFIRLVAESNPESGGDEVETFHRALFLHHHGPALERCQAERRFREERVADLDQRLRRTRDRLASEDRLLPVLENGQPDLQPSAPWNAWDRAMFAAGVLAILALLVFGVFNVSFNLLESGIVTFAEHPARAYFWAALLPVGALAVKTGWDVLRNSRLRTAYLWSCLGLGLLAVLVWVVTYASIYPTLSKTTADQIASLSVFDAADAPGAGADPLGHLTAGGAKRLDMILVAAQAIAEICLSAALGIYLTQLYARHRPVRLAANPAFVQFDAHCRTLETEVEQDRLSIARAKGEETRLHHQLEVFVAYARSLFQKESQLRRDRGHQQRALLDELSEHLRTRLAAIEESQRPGEPADRLATKAGSDSVAGPGNGNGRGPHSANSNATATSSSGTRSPGDLPRIVTG